MVKKVEDNSELYAITVNSEPKSAPEIPAKALDLVHDFWDVFPDDLPAGLPPARPVDHKIELYPGQTPPSRPNYRLSYPEQEELQRQFADLLKKGFIRPSISLYSAPVLFVHKKEGDLRMHHDYRLLNK